MKSLQIITIPLHIIPFNQTLHPLLNFSNLINHHYLQRKQQNSKQNRQQFLHRNSLFPLHYTNYSCIYKVGSILYTFIQRLLRLLLSFFSLYLIHHNLCQWMLELFIQLKQISIQNLFRHWHFGQQFHFS